MSEVKRYDVLRDEWVPVTQEWVDGVETLLKSFGEARKVSKIIVENEKAGIVARHHHQRFLSAWRPEFETKAHDRAIGPDGVPSAIPGSGRHEVEIEGKPPGDTPAPAPSDESRDPEGSLGPDAAKRPKGNDLKQGRTL